MEMVNAIPKKIEGFMKFPSHTAEDKPVAKYTMKAISELEGCVNTGSILACKILMHLDRP